MKKQAKRTGRQAFLRFLFLLYGGAMLWLLFGQRFGSELYSGDYAAQLENNINLTPLVTVKLYLRLLENGANPALLRHAVINLVGNVVMFVPLGIFIPGIFMKKPNFFKFLLTVTAMIVLVELVQLFTLLGSLDIDDLILNLVGATIGYILWKLHTLHRKK